MKKFLASILMISIVLCFSACSDNGQPDDYPVKIASYTFEEKPDSVVCLSDSVADIIIACGYADVVKGRSDECSQTELSAVLSVGTKSKPNTQKILETNPDVVFADKTLSDSVTEKLRENNITVLTMMPANTTKELISLYSNIGAVLNGNITGRENGENKATSITLTMGDLQRIIPEKNVVTTACYLYDINGTSASDNTFCGKLFSYANAVNVCPSKDEENTFEAIKLSDPQYIFCDKGVKQQIENSENFKGFTAVKNGNIYEIDDLLFERQGNSITQVLSYMIETMYPEISQSSNQQSSSESSNETSTQESSQESSEESAEESSQESSEESSEESIEEIPEESSEESSEENSDTSVPETSLDITDDMWYQQGEQHENITIIQQRLAELGFMDEEPTGYYGEATFEAVQAFEEENNLTVDGFLDNSDLKTLFNSED